MCVAWVDNCGQQELLIRFFLTLPRHLGLELVEFISARYPILQTAVERHLQSSLVDLCRAVTDE